MSVGHGLRKSLTSYRLTEAFGGFAVWVLRNHLNLRRTFSHAASNLAVAVWVLQLSPERSFRLLQRMKMSSLDLPKG